MRICLSILAGLLATVVFIVQNSIPAKAQTSVSILQVPGVNEYSRINPAGNSVLCSGRYVTPVGNTMRITRAPFGLQLTPDGTKAVILHHTGVISVASTNKPVLTEPQVVRIPSYDGKIKSVLDGAAFLGVAFSKDSKTAYLSGGDKGSVVLMSMESFTKTGEIKLDGILGGTVYTDSFTSDLTINHSRNELLVLDRANFRLVRIDLKTQKITASIKTGRIPFGIALSPDKKLAFVANVGLYEYPAVPGVTAANKDSLMLRFPPYATPSKEAETGVVLPDGRKIPGLGSPLADEAMSVWMVDLAKNQVVAKLKTGYQIGEMAEGNEIIGGSSPNSIAVGKQFAYVTNATNDNVSIIDYATKKIAGEIPIKVDPRIDSYRGLMPFGICLSKDEKTLFVALLGLNAVAVIDTKTKQTLGLIPTGWGTTRVVLSAGGNRLFITSARGYGAGPNGGKNFLKPPQGTYIGDIQLGTLQIVKIQKGIQWQATLKKYTRQVVENTFREVKITTDDKNPLPPLPKLWPSATSPIKHIVYVTKENRTYDEVFGQLPQAKGDATLARFGVDVQIEELVSSPLGGSRKGVSVSPNHHKISRQFAFSDNFYCDSDASIHGHHWMIGQVPNEYVEANSAASAKFNAFSDAPGRRFPKATGGIDPEDYNEIGGLWENLARHGVSFYNFGQANEYAGVEEEWNHTSFGSAFPVAIPLPKAVFNRTSRKYAGFNMNIPDQYRADQFEEEFTEMWLSGRDTMPSLVAVQLPNDHGADVRPKDGYPYAHSFMADNDLALGRMLHFLSRTKYWKNTLVVITEDDPQGGVDHVDAHRSVLMMAGPYVAKNHVSHTHANFGSLLKVIYNILSMSYVNQYDATASLLQDFFSPQPDFTPYTVELPDTRIFDAQKTLDKYGKTFDWRKIQQGPKLDNESEQRKEHYRQNPR